MSEQPQSKRVDDVEIAHEMALAMDRHIGKAGGLKGLRNELSCLPPDEPNHHIYFEKIPLPVRGPFSSLSDSSQKRIQLGYSGRFLHDLRSDDISDSLKGLFGTSAYRDFFYDVLEEMDENPDYFSSSKAQTISNDRMVRYLGREIDSQMGESELAARNVLIKKEQKERAAKAWEKHFGDENPYHYLGEDTELDEHIALTTAIERRALLSKILGVLGLQLEPKDLTQGQRVALIELVEIQRGWDIYGDYVVAAVMESDSNVTAEDVEYLYKPEF